MNTRDLCLWPTTEVQFLYVIYHTQTHTMYVSVLWRVWVFRPWLCLTGRRRSSSRTSSVRFTPLHNIWTSQHYISVEALWLAVVCQMGVSWRETLLNWRMDPQRSYNISHFKRKVRVTSDLPSGHRVCLTLMCVCVCVCRVAGVRGRSGGAVGGRIDCVHSSRT